MIKIYNYTQYDFKNIGGRSIVVDLYVVDSKGRHINIEFQKNRNRAYPQRARYHESVLDGHVTVPKEKWNNIPEVYIFFITEKDIFNRGKAIYHVERIMIETSDMFQDGEHIVYINGEYENEEKLNHLMHDMKCQEASEMYYEVLVKEVRYYKESEEGKLKMCEISEKIKESGRVEGRNEMQKEIVKKMLLTGKFSYEDISISTGMRVVDILALL